jgi:manganese/zinc/iron transport system permease protein
MGADFVQFSLTPILIGIFASVACALPGNFLILRRQALIGDAISHVVLPGIVVAFLLTGWCRRCLCCWAQQRRR